PVVLYLHQLDMGDDPSGLMDEINPWFNTAQFRADYPAIVVVPLLDQTADTSGQTINFGGVSGPDTAGEDNAIAALKQVMSQYSSDSSRVYVTGNSMGGIGSWDMMIKYNAYDGTEGKIFAAGMPLAGAEYADGYPTPDPSVVSELQNVPIWAIHGAQDTQVPTTWDEAMAAALSGSSTFHFTLDQNLGHDVWDTYYPLPNGATYWNWLFSQKAGGTAPSTAPTPTPTPTPTATASPNDTVVMAGSASAITDANGNQWTITSGGQVAVNGTADASTANVVELAYVGNEVWQENSAKLWWGKTSTDASWSPNAGTSTSPLPATVAPTPTPTPAPTPTPTPTPTATPSPNDTVVMAGSA